MMSDMFPEEPDISKCIPSSLAGDQRNCIELSDLYALLADDKPFPKDKRMPEKLLMIKQAYSCTDIIGDLERKSSNHLLPDSCH